MIKKILFLTLLITTITQSTFAQESEGGFEWNRVFAGGTVVFDLGFGNNSQFTIGGNPEIGYSVFKRLDLGICGNYIYTSSSFAQETTSGITKQKTRVTLSGLGIFTRIHITDGFFLQLQPEFNTIKYKRFLENPDITIEEDSYPSSSFLVGAGFGTHDVGNANFFTAILIDVQKNLNSPYRTINGGFSPIIRGGVNFYFNRKKK